MPLTVLAFLRKYKHIIGYLMTAIACGLVVWYSVASIKDHYWQSIASRQQAQIVQLQARVAADDIRVAQLDVQVTQAKASVEHSDKVAAVAQAKVNVLLAKYEPKLNIQTSVLPPLPTVQVTFSDLPECEKAVTVLQADIGTFITEIKADRNLITDLKTENQLLEQKDAILTQETNDLKSIEKAQAVVIDAKDKQIAAEKTKTKIWKRIATGAAIVIGALLL